MKQEEKKKLPYDFDSFKFISTPALRDLLVKWKKERGYHFLNNPGARHHIKEKK